MTVPDADPRGPDRVRVADVLVVDDSSTIRRILRRDLEAAGYVVREAADGAAGLEACRVELPDLVLLDVDMPVLDGLATMARMQEDPALRTVPVLFLTARTGGTEVARGLDLGAHDYLKKPCDQTELLARVSAALRRKAMEDVLAARTRELASQTATDALTGLGNRRLLDQRLTELDPARALGVLIVDIDHFKKVNDEFGHIVGDAVLAIAAARLRGACGQGEILVRWGGEEFVVAVPGVELDALRDLAERIRTCIEHTPFAVGTVEPVAVTVSVGAAVGPTEDFTEVLRSADTALYEAKAGGRNQVRTAGAS